MCGAKMSAISSSTGHAAPCGSLLTNSIPSSNTLLRVKVSLFLGQFVLETAAWSHGQKNTFDAFSFESFQKLLLRHSRKGRKMIVIVDNARWHHAIMLQPWLRKHQEVLRLDFLPPDSPDLNPVERVWKMTRHLCTHNRSFATLEELTKVVFDQFLLWVKSNSQLRHLCAFI
jgi:transposase